MIQLRTIQPGKAGLREWLIFGAIAAACLLYWPSIEALIDLWRDTDRTTYTHGFLIAALSAWLLWRERSQIAAELRTPQPAAALVLVLLGMVWLVANRAGILTVSQLLLPAIVWIALYALFGGPLARRCLFAIGYLYFATSVWDMLTPALQWGTILAARFMLRASGITAYFEGEQVHIPSGVFAIEGGCSGLHFFIVALAIAALHGELAKASVGMRLKIIALAAGFAVISNWIRVFVIIAAGHLTQMQHYLVRVDHYKFGWLLFAVTIPIFFFVAGRITDPQASQAEGATKSSTSPILVRREGLGWGYGVLVAVALALPPVWGMLAQRFHRSAAIVDLPQAPAGWSGPAPAGNDWQPVFKNADRLAQGIYRNAARPERAVEVFTAVYRTQRQGKELRGYGNSVTGGLEASTSRPLTIAGRAGVESTTVDADGGHWILWQGYAIDGRWFPDPITAQLWYGVRSLVSAPVSRVLALRAACESECKTARSTIVEFLQSTE